MDKQKIFNIIGVPKTLIWGYMGVAIFMIGEGLEQGWLSPYLVERGIAESHAALVFSIYGIAVAVGSWLSGVFVQTFGPKKVMAAGVCLFVIGDIIFIIAGVIPVNYHVMLITYGIKGLGYPFFAYSFLTWIPYRTNQNKLSAAVGWFYFAFSLGFQVLAPFFSGFMIPKVGHVNTLWAGLIFTIVGGIFGLILNKDKFDDVKEKDKEIDAKQELVKGITILYKNPKVAMGGFVRMVNGFHSFGFNAFLPLYLAGFGFSTAAWLTLSGFMFAASLIFNVLLGKLGDIIGWRTTVAWIGSVGSGIATLAILYVPQIFGHNYIAIFIALTFSGAVVAGFVPLSAIMPSLAPNNKGAAMSALNLGAGMSQFIAPLIVSICISSIGTTGIMWIFSILYFVVAIMTKFLTPPAQFKT